MTSDTVRWTYALAPDAAVDPGDGGAFLRTATDRTWIKATRGQLEILRRLSTFDDSEASLQRQLRQIEPEENAQATCASLLYRLDRLGLLTRTLESSGRQLVSCVPRRPPGGPPPGRPRDGPLRLSPRALVRPERGVVALEVPGAWAKVTIHDRELLPLVHDLATGRSSAELGAEARAHSEEAISEVLALMDWCGLLDGAGADGWSAHDLFLHTQSRMGYARTVLGKTSPGGEPASSAAGATADTARRVALRLPDLAHLLAVDPPHALVSERRLSDRRHGSDPLTADQLSEFLFRTLHERGGRRPYPSAGSCYPLRAYLAVHSCAGVEPGLYAYDAAVHELTRIGPPGPGLERLLWNAAGAANIDQPPQMLLVLAARYARTRRVYGDLAYSLILKEVGAVIQTALMSAAAMGLAVCPLGCGDSLLFSDLTGVDTLTETSVGELMLGSREERLQG